MDGKVKHIGSHIDTSSFRNFVIGEWGGVASPMIWHGAAWHGMIWDGVGHHTALHCTV